MCTWARASLQLQEVSERGQGPSASVHVRYRGDEAIYKEWSPSRQSDIVDEGLLDPRFGSGPVYYADLGLVEVRLSDWATQKGEQGREDFQSLKSALADQSDLELTEDVVAWREGFGLERAVRMERRYSREGLLCQASVSC